MIFHPAGGEGVAQGLALPDHANSSSTKYALSMNIYSINA
jgi:hypothetical protein